MSTSTVEAPVMTPLRQLASVGEWESATSAVCGVGNRLARTLADTLRALYPSAAYLVMERDEHNDDLSPHSIRDDQGKILYRFSYEWPRDGYPPYENRLPDTFRLMRAVWDPYDPENPAHVAELIDQLQRFGCLFDHMPHDLPAPDNPNRREPCLLLSETARPERWEAGGVLRPYSAPRPEQAQ
ncbi:hypothetical protein [Streptomyces sp. NPDC001536]|uniref:hypothetical protein n=1 Tax=Streptomyces sp. NPDC001536 TaxID=3364583 RepID=UPI003681481A